LHVTVALHCLLQLHAEPDAKLTCLQRSPPADGRVHPNEPHPWPWEACPGQRGGACTDRSSTHDQDRVTAADDAVSLRDRQKVVPAAVRGGRLKIIGRPQLSYCHKSTSARIKSSNIRWFITATGSRVGGYATALRSAHGLPACDPPPRNLRVTSGDNTDLSLLLLRLQGFFSSHPVRAYRPINCIALHTKLYLFGTAMYSVGQISASTLFVFEFRVPRFFLLGTLYRQFLCCCKKIVFVKWRRSSSGDVNTIRFYAGKLIFFTVGLD